MALGDTMSKQQELLSKLQKLQDEYGRFLLHQAFKEFDRRKLQAFDREKRQRFSWVFYRKLYNRQRGICPLCDGTMPLLKGEVEIDHRDPNRNDFNSEGNLQLTHKKCNRAKSAKSILRLSKESGRTIHELLK